MIKNLEEKLKFIELMDEMKNIERYMLLKNGRRETDAEHSFHLAMMVMTFAEDFPQLDIFKCVKMALYHDLVEIFAGDVAFLVDKEGAETKDKKEREALKKLEDILGNDSFQDIKNIILEYMNGQTKEARFIYQLDRIQPLIQVIIEGGKSWHKWGYKKRLLIQKHKEIFKEDEFGLKIIVDKYFEKAKKENMFYI